MTYHTESFPLEERRTIPDRRAQPTTFGSVIFRLYGRRAGFRRAGEEYNAYVDQSSRRVILFVLFIMLASIFDAFLTLRHLSNGGSEANPAMAFLLQQGTLSFLYVKVALTGVGSWLLATHEHFPCAFYGLFAMAIVYGMLMVFHTVMF